MKGDSSSNKPLRGTRNEDSTLFSIERATEWSDANAVVREEAIDDGSGLVDIRRLGQHYLNKNTVPPPPVPPVVVPTAVNQMVVPTDPSTPRRRSRRVGLVFAFASIGLVLGSAGLVLALVLTSSLPGTSPERSAEVPAEPSAQTLAEGAPMDLRRDSADSRSLRQPGVSGANNAITASGAPVTLAVNTPIAQEVARAREAANNDADTEANQVIVGASARTSKPVTEASGNPVRGQLQTATRTATRTPTQTNEAPGSQAKESGQRRVTAATPNKSLRPRQTARETSAPAAPARTSVGEKRASARPALPDGGQCLEEVACLLASDPPACCNRYLESRAQAPSVSARGQRQGLPETLNRRAIQVGINSVRTAAMACRQADAQGMVSLDIEVGGDGRVDGVKVKSAPSEEVGACVAEVVSKARFAATKHGRRFVYPFVLR